MKGILILAGALISLDLFSQVSTDSILKQNFLQALGKHISLDNHFGPTNRVRSINGNYSVSYLPAKQDSIRYGSVNFGIVHVFINNHDKIKALIYEKGYSSTDSVYVNNKLNEDFISIAKQISIDYNTNFKIIGEPSDVRFYREAAVWQINKHRIKLIKSHGELGNGSFNSYLEILLL